MLTYRCPALRLHHWTMSSPGKFGNKAWLLFMLRGMLATLWNEKFSPKSLSCLEHRSGYKMRDQSLRRRLCGLCYGSAWSGVSSGLRLLLWSLNANHMSLLLLLPPTKVLNSPENQAHSSNSPGARTMIKPTSFSDPWPLFQLNLLSYIIICRHMYYQKCMAKKITSLILWQNTKTEVKGSVFATRSTHTKWPLPSVSRSPTNYASHLRVTWKLTNCLFRSHQPL